MSLRSALQQFRDLLFNPGAFFARNRPRERLSRASTVVAGIAILTTVSVGAIGRLFTSRIDATVTETTMEPWPEATCAGFEGMDTPAPEPCRINESATREVDVGAEVWSEFVGYLPWVFVAVFVSWFLLAIALHLLSALLGGEGSFAGTLAVAGWSMVLEVVQLGVGLASTYVLLSGQEFTGDLETISQQLEQVTATTSTGADILIAVVVVGWQAYIWAHGLRYARQLEYGPAAIVAATVAVLSFLLLHL